MKILSIFDFDGTLTQKDSLPQFLSMLTSPLKVYWLFFIFSLKALFIKLATPSFDWKTYIKIEILKQCLTNKDISSITPILETLKGKISWNKRVCNKLIQHKEQGSIILVASGALDIYLPALLKDLPIDHIICTEMSLKDTKLTGSIGGENCVRAEKAKRVKKYIDENGPFEKIFGYGNAPCDIPMLNLTDEAFYI